MTSFSISVLRKVLGILFICLWIFTLAKAEDGSIAKTKMAIHQPVTCINALQVPVQQPGVDNCIIVRTPNQLVAIQITGRW